MALSSVTRFAREPDQFGFVVSDVAASAEMVFQVFGLQPWLGFDYNGDTLARRTMRGEPGDFSSRSVVWGPGRLSLIQPISGRSVFSETLDRRGPGLHHIGYFVPSIARTRKRLAASGYEEVMSGGGHGIAGDGEFAFFDLGERIGCLLEIIEQPAQRRTPDFVFRWNQAVDGP